MPISLPPPYTGRCPCNTIQYTIHAPPLISHCCHCTSCQHESGSAFVINAFVEAPNLTFSPSSPALLQHTLPTASAPGGGYDAQHQFRCPECYAWIYSHFGAPQLCVVQAGTLDEEVRRALVPDVQIWTRSKLPWVKLGEGRVFEEGYDRGEVWSEESLKRREAYQEEVKEWYRVMEGKGEGKERDVGKVVERKEAV